MPIYEYRCDSCQKVAEVIQKISDPTPEQCPNCETQGTLKKLVSQSAFVLKGSGWYVTDFRGDKKDAKKSEGGSSSSESTSSTSDAKTDSGSKSSSSSDSSPSSSSDSD